MHRLCQDSRDRFSCFYSGIFTGHVVMGHWYHHTAVVGYFWGSAGMLGRRAEMGVRAHVGRTNQTMEGTVL